MNITIACKKCKRVCHSKKFTEAVVKNRYIPMCDKCWKKLSLLEKRARRSIPIVIFSTDGYLDY